VSVGGFHAGEGFFRLTAFGSKEKVITAMERIKAVFGD
jgi:aspartate/methionine/tyrosine aminotransferase